MASRRPSRASPSPSVRAERRDPEGASHADTRQRLLAAAGPVFAAHGFRDATVREICGRAGANVAAVNYHFGDKQGLYRAVLQHGHDQGRERFMAEVPSDGPPERRLRIWLRGFLHKALDPDRPAWLPKLMMREMTEPTTSLDDVIHSSLRPQFEQLAGIVASLTARPVESPEVRDAAIGVIGNCLIYRLCPVVLSRMLQVEPRTQQEIDMLADSIAARSLRGLRGIRASVHTEERPA